MAVTAHPGSAETEDRHENQRENSPAAATQHRDRMIHDRLSGRSNLAARRAKRPHSGSLPLTRPYLVGILPGGRLAAARVRLRRFALAGESQPELAFFVDGWAVTVPQPLASSQVAPCLTSTTSGTRSV